MNEQVTLQKVAFLIGQKVEEARQQLLSEMHNIEERLDTKGLSRAREVRASMPLGIQQWSPEKAKWYTGGSEPDSGLGDNYDVYNRVVGGEIISTYLKLEGSWSKIGDYPDNNAQVALNTADIATNAASIAANTTYIATNAADIATNAASIAANTASIGTNITDIATNATNIASNVADIAALDTRVGDAEAAIASNDSDIADIATDAANNATNIATNASAITALDGRLTTAETDIDDAEIDIATFQAKFTNPTLVVAWQTADQAIAITATPLTGWTEVSDLNSDFNAATGVFTCAETGWYRVFFNPLIKNHDTQDRLKAILQQTGSFSGNADTTYQPAARNAFTTVPLSSIVYMEVGDTLRPAVSNLDKACSTVGSYLENTKFCIERVLR